MERVYYLNDEVKHYIPVNVTTSTELTGIISTMSDIPTKIRSGLYPTEFSTDGLPYSDRTPAGSLFMPRVASSDGIDPNTGATGRDQRMGYMLIKIKNKEEVIFFGLECWSPSDITDHE